MDKYIIIRDKKIVAYILSALFLIITCYILMGIFFNDIFENSVITANFSFIFVVISLYSVFLNYFFLKDSIQFVKFKETHMNFGTLNLMSADYAEIEDVSFDGNINIIIRNKARKIRVFNIEENLDKYKSILDALALRTGIEFNTADALDKLRENNAVKYETGGPPLRLGSWVMVIFVSLIITCASNLLLLGISSFPMILNPETAPISLVQAVYFIINALISIAAVILMIKRMKAAIAIIKAIYALAFLNSIVNAVLSYFTPALTSQSFSASMILSVFSSLAIMLLLFRYLNISRRVRKTFIYEKFTVVTKAGRQTDPPFKLFSKEPASLYGIFCWLALPVVIFVLFVIMVISLIFSSLVI